MINLNAQQFMQVLPEIIQKGGAIMHRPKTPLVHLGLENDIDEEYCKENNIPIFRVQRSGGAIVSNINDFEFVIVNKETDTNKMPPLFNKLVHLLVSKNVNVKIENNDLLAEGYKVASWSYRTVPGGIYTAMHISMSVNLKSIKNICKKEMHKVPKGLNDFGITNEEVERLVEETKYEF